MTVMLLAFANAAVVVAMPVTLDVDPATPLVLAGAPAERLHPFAGIALRHPGN